jgi:ribosomal protein S18 acetylase RimI-like enzyme
MMSSDVITISNNPEVVLRRATSADVEFANELSFKIMDSVVAVAWNGRFRWESWFNDVEEAIHDDVHMFFIVRVEEEKVGYLWMNEEHNTLWITAIVLEKQWQRRGIGDQIIKRLIIESKNNGKEAIELGVQQNNQAALDFYYKMGFEKYDAIRSANTDLLRLLLKKPKNLTYS